MNKHSTRYSLECTVQCKFTFESQCMPQHANKNASTKNKTAAADKTKKKTKSKKKKKLKETEARNFCMFTVSTS